ncbi:TonB-dependent siderophore receptor [Stutzerimonas stutzeri]|jgi:iron complex outermembrane recepter protein|uniref:TonB-dependent siderophore receptor n=1 Tax=Stutzerimonas stutzeri TaxID=316 RepID=UPI002449E44B|nr:TonB-dependent siderophore receptor [Stutzerimonas stutzeri]MBW8337724.1 TonB-dependent siderophore receptor [Pseudomonas sp.]MDH0059822.1 TonB-dependent siderophore receptor [Stutzerimonas stutzeri]
MQSSRSFTVRLVLCAPLTFLALAPFAVTPLAASAAQVSGEQTFDIPSGPLGRVLNEFSRQAGVYLVGSHELAQNHQSDGLRGRHSIQQGLEHLLRGTGLQAVRQGASGYVLQPGSAVDVVQLQPMSVIGAEVQDANGQSDAGYRAIQSATASKTNTSVLEIPRSISVVTRRRMDDQKSQTLTEVLGYVPGIFAPPFAAGDGQAGDLFFIRGFNATDYGYGLLRDGLRVQGNRYDTTSEPFGLERVEVFRGPTSILYGENAPGGVVNLVSKRPTVDSRGEVQLSYGTHDRRQLGVDVSGPLNEGGSVLGRMVVLGRKSDTQVDHQPDDRLYLAPSLTLNFDDANALTLLGTYQRDRTLIELGYPAAGTLLRHPNGKIDPSTLLGNPDWDDFERETWTLGYEYSHRFNESWQFRQNSRYMQSRIDRQEMWPGNLDNAGFGTNVINTAYDRENRSIAYSLDNQVEGNFKLAEVDNTLLVGASLDRTSFNQNWNAGFGGIVNVFDPVYTGSPVTSTAVQNALLEQRLYGLYTQLQSRIDNWVFLLGGRYDRVNSSYRNKAGTLNAPADLDYWDGQFTWQAGLMYQFDNGVSPYLSYSTAYNPTQQVSSTSGPLDPTTSEQYEAGVKYEPKGWNTTVSASIYDLRKKDDSLYDSVVGDYRNIGRSRAKGVELEVSSDLTDNFNLTSAYTYTDSRITKDAPGSLLEDRQITGVPRNQASIWATYRFLDGGLKGLRIGGGVRHFDSTFAYTSPALYGKFDTGDVTLVDAALGYSINEQWSAELNARNVLDKEYVAGCNNAGRCYWGEERTLLATLTYDW